MCELVYKTERKRLTDEKIKQLNDESYKTLLHYKLEENNADKNVNNLLQSIKE